jgi:hypothetical protein
LVPGAAVTVMVPELATNAPVAEALKLIVYAASLTPATSGVTDTETAETDPRPVAPALSRATPESADVTMVSANSKVVFERHRRHFEPGVFAISLVPFRPTDALTVLRPNNNWRRSSSCTGQTTVAPACREAIATQSKCPFERA